ncbi:MAG TPA: glycosyltransferase family 39 protein [Anaerolineales bacterium]|nr:glycosyltransferase family 39 protein [Anaerolineales bacterium]HLO28948.1 glycosyltransferase family 39 protein [Anaerolineales bacterium]
MSNSRRSSPSFPSGIDLKKLFSRNAELTDNSQRLRLRLLLEITLTCGLILAIGLPRLLALNRFVTTDERLWLERSGRFYYALAHHDFAATFQKSHPGVTVMWAGLTGYLRVFPRYSESQAGQNRPIGFGALERREPDLLLRILVAGRQAMILLSLATLVMSFLFARRLFGMLPALIGFLLIAFDPFHIALSRVLHLDGLLGDLMMLSLLAFLVYLEERNRLAFIVSAIAAGLAWLTKSPGLFLIPLIALLAFFYELRLRKVESGAGWQNFILRYIGMLAAWGLFAGLIFCLFWPAMWVDPVNSLVKVFTDAIGYAQAGHDSAVFFNGKIYANGEIPDLSFYPVSFLWRTSPITLLGLLLMPMLFLRKRLAFRADDPGNSNSLVDDSKRRRWAVAALLLFALGFAALMSFGLKKFDRYLIPSIAPLDMVAGVGLVWPAGWVGQFFHERWRAVLIGVILLSLIAVQSALAWKAFPYFFNYYNPLLGGSRQAVKVMQVGWGEGLDQAANYLNNKPNSDQLRVMAWYAGGPFSYFSKSQVSALDVDHPWSDADWNEFNKSDYAVVYIHEWQRDLPAEVLARLRDSKPEYSVWINGLEYVEVYKIR